MKLRHPFFIKIAGFALSIIFPLWLGTLRYTYRPLRRNLDPRRPKLKDRFVYVCWHETLLQPVFLYRKVGVNVLVSQHSDGEFLAEMFGYFRLYPVRGSTNRGGAAALRKLMREGSNRHFCITPDGPRGPRRRLQAGAVYLASQVGMAVVAAGYGFDRPWRLNSWDRFAVPRPWTRGFCVTDEPIHVPPDLTKEGVEHYREIIEKSLEKVTRMAEQWASQKKK